MNDELIKKLRPYRGLIAIALATIAVLVAIAGREAINFAISVAPDWKDTIEVIGGVTIGILAAVVFIYPTYELWGIFKKS